MAFYYGEILVSGNANPLTYGTSWALAHDERNVSDTGDGIDSRESVAGFAVHFHHSSYDDREGAGCYHV